MGDDFREEYTDVKNMAFPSCPQEWILFWLFPVDLVSRSKTRYWESHLSQRKKKESTWNVFSWCCCTNWIQVHCCGTKMICIGKKNSTWQILRPSRLLWSWSRTNRGLWSWSCGWWQNGWKCKNSIWKLERVEAPQHVVCQQTEKHCVHQLRQATTCMCIQSYRNWGIGRCSSFWIHQGVSCPGSRENLILLKPAEQMGALIEPVLLQCWTNIIKMFIVEWYDTS